MNGSSTRMNAKSRETPDVLRRQEKALELPIAELVAVLRRKPPRLVMTCARGSSAHAATYGKHLIERYLGIPVSAAAPNIVSIYRGSLTFGTSCSSRSLRQVAAPISSRPLRWHGLQARSPSQSSTIPPVLWRKPAKLFFPWRLARN